MADAWNIYRFRVGVYCHLCCHRVRIMMEPVHPTKWMMSIFSDRRNVWPLKWARAHVYNK